MRALHRVRESLVQDKVKTTNQMHAFLLEFGISVPRGAAVISRLSTILEDSGLAPIFPDTFYHLTHYWSDAAGIHAASGIPEHCADAIRYSVRTLPQGSSLPSTRQASA